MGYISNPGVFGQRADGSPCPTEIVEERDYFDDWNQEWVMRTREKRVCEGKGEDLDTHRYRCTVCGDIGYYSGAAARFFEEGKTSDVPGLEKLVENPNSEK